MCANSSTCWLKAAGLPDALASAKDAGALENGESASSPQAAENRDGKAFEVDSIKLAAGGDHPRWVVKGGNFKKFGVTCWPETLQAAGIVAKLDPLKDNKPRGRWMARFVERLNEEGRWVPDKVTELVKQKG